MHQTRSKIPAKDPTAPTKEPTKDTPAATDPPGKSSDPSEPPQTPIQAVKVPMPSSAGPTTHQTPNDHPNTQPHRPKSTFGSGPSVGTHCNWNSKPPLGNAQDQAAAPGALKSAPGGAKLSSGAGQKEAAVSIEAKEPSRPNSAGSGRNKVAPEEAVAREEDDGVVTSPFQEAAMKVSAEQVMQACSDHKHANMHLFI